MSTTLSSGRTCSQRLIAGLLVTLQILTPALHAATAWAQSTPTAIDTDRSVAGQRPVVNVAANGVPVVQVSPASAAGVSNNRFTAYNVGPKGVVLNNTGANNQTQLAGWIAGNPMLGNTSAKTILNQVTGTTPTSLAGYTEVAGNQANVIVANPNGITCAGCGFINAPRVTMSTGVPEIGADGAMLGFQVQQGQISIEGSGLSARNVDRVDLISRSLRVNAEIWANRLDVVTGAGHTGYETGSVTAHAAADAAPPVSLDVSQLGGMYANSIRLIGTESGLGVNSAGDIEALTGNLEVTQAGDVRIAAGRFRAAEDLNVSSGANLDNAGVLMAGKNLDIRSGGLKNSGSLASGAGVDGAIKSAGNLSITATGNLQNTGQIVSGNDLTLSTTGKLENVAGVIESRNLLHVDAPRIDNSLGVMKQTAEADSPHGNARGIEISNGSSDAGAPGILINNKGTIASNASTAIFAHAFSNAHGTVQSKAELWIKGESGIDNTGGSLLASSDLRIVTDAAFINNAGKISSDQEVSIAAKGGLANNNEGSIQGTSVHLGAATIDNSAGRIVQTGTNSQSINLAGGFRNIDGTIASNAENLTINANAIDNSRGDISHAGTGTLTLNADESVNNAQGKVIGNGHIAIAGANATISNVDGTVLSSGSTKLAARTLDNTSGIIAASGDMELDVSGKMNNRGGALRTGGSLNLAAGSLDNSKSDAHASGSIIATGTKAMRMNVAGDLNNEDAVISAKGSFTLNADRIANARGTIFAAGDLDASVIKSLDNHGGVLQSDGQLKASFGGALDNRQGLVQGGSLSLEAGTLANAAGVIQQSGHGESAIVVAGTLDNAAGRILSDGGALRIQASSVDNSAGTVSATGGQLDIQAVATINNNAGQLITADTLTVKAATLSNRQGGQIQSVASAVLAVNGDVANTGGVILSGDTLTIQAAGNIENGAGTIESARDASFSAKNLNNVRGSITSLGDSTISIDAQQSLDNTDGRLGANGSIAITTKDSFNNTRGTIITGKDLEIDTDRFLNKSGKLDVSGVLTLKMKDVLDNRGNRLAAQGGLIIQAASIDNGVDDLAVKGELIVNGAGPLKLIAKDGINNTGGYIGGNGDVALAATSVDNRAGAVYAAKTLAITASGDVDNRKGSLEAGAGFTSRIGGRLDNREGVIQASVMDLQAGSLDNRAGQALQLGAGSNLIDIKGLLDNAGGRLASNGANLAIRANALDNGEGSITHAGDGKLEIISSGVVRNDGGRILTKGELAIDAQSVTNNLLNGTSALIQSEKNAQITARDALNNSQGTIASSAGLAVNANGDVDNRRGTIQAGKALTLRGNSIDNGQGTAVSLDRSNVSVFAVKGLVNEEGNIGGNGDVAIVVDGGGIANGKGSLYASRALSISAKADVDNRQGAIQADSALTVRVDGMLDNRNGLTQSDLIDFQAGGLDNRAGKLLHLGTGDSVMTVANGLNNAGGSIYSAGSTLRISAGSVDNGEGAIKHNGAGKLGIYSTGAVGNDGGQIITRGELAIEAQSVSNKPINGKAALIQSETNARISTGEGIDNTGGTILSAAALNANANGDAINRGGIIQAGQALALGGNTIDNTGGNVVSMDVAGMNLSAVKGLINESGFIGGNGRVAVAVMDGGIANAKGNIYAKDALSVSTAQDVDNKQGTLQAVAAFSGEIAGVLDNRDGLLQADRMDVQAGGVDNRAGRMLQLNDGAGTTSTVTVRETFSNAGGNLMSNNGVLTLTAGSIDNAGGTIVSKSVLAASAAGDIDNRSGAMEAADSLALYGTNIDNTGGRAVSAGGGVGIHARAKLVNDQGLIGTNGAVTITAGAATNVHGRIASQTDIDLAADGLTNDNGDIRAARALQAKVTGVLSNGGGSIQSTSASINAGSLENGNGKLLVTGSAPFTLNVTDSIDNSGGFISANGDASLGAKAITNAGGTIYAKNLLGIYTGELANIGGILQADSRLTVRAAEEIVNRQGLLQAALFDLQAPSIDNRLGKLLQLGSSDTTLVLTGAVRNGQGTIATNGGNFTLSAASIENSEGDIRHAGAGTFNITSAGAIINNGGKLRTESDMRIDAQSVSDKPQNGQAALIQAGKKIDVTVKDDFENSGGTLEAGTLLNLKASSIDNSGGRIVTLGTAEMTIRATDRLANDRGLIGGNGAVVLGVEMLSNDSGSVSGGGDVTLTAGALNGNNGSIKSGGVLTAQVTGALNTSGGLMEGTQVALTATEIDNTDGTVYAKSRLSIDADRLDNTGGTLEAGTTLAINADRGLVNKQGTMQAEQLAVQAPALDNSGGRILQLGKGNTDLVFAGALNNARGTIAVNGDNLTLAASSIDNSEGDIRHAGGGVLEFGSMGALNNDAGSLRTAGALTIGAQTVRNAGGLVQSTQGAIINAAADIVNVGGSILSGAALSAQAAGKINNTGGALEAANTLAIAAGSIDNSKGRAVSLDASGVAIAVTGGVVNTEGKIGGNGNVTLETGSISNRLGKITAVADLGITAGSIDNKEGSIQAGSTLVARTAGALDTAGGNIQAAQAAITAASLDNSAGKLVATGAAPLAITVSGGTTNTNGFIGSNGDLVLAAQNVDNRDGVVYAKSKLELGSDILDNTAGTLEAGGKLSVTASHELVNQHGVMQADRIALRAPSLDNSTGTILQTGDTDTVLDFSGALKNAHGSIASNGSNLRLSASSVDNSLGEITHAGVGSFNIDTAGSLDNSGGKLRTAGAAAIDAQRVGNVSGLIESRLNASIVSHSDIDARGGSVLSGGALTLQTPGTLNNAGGVVEAGKALVLQAASIDNTKGRTVSYDASGISIHAMHSMTNREGTIGANGAVALGAADFNNTLGRIAGLDNVEVVASAITNTGGAITSQRQLTIDTGADGFLDNRENAILQGERLNLNAPNLSNAGGSILQTGASDLHLRVNDIFRNTGGTLATNGANLSVSAQGIENDGGHIRHGGTGSMILAIPGVISNSNGTISSNGNAVVSATGVTNTSGGMIEAQGTLNASAGNSWNNNGGTLQSEGALTISAPDMSNAGGTMYSDGKLTLDVPDLTNTGGTLAADEIAFRSMRSVKNAGGRITQTGAHALNLVVSQDIDNAGGTIAANGNVTLGGTALKNMGGTVRAAAGGVLNVNISGAIDNAGGTMAADGLLSAGASSINNQGGQITGSQQLALSTPGNINNNQGTIASIGDNQVSAGSLSNRGGTVASVSGRLAINTPASIDNTGGRLESGRDLALAVPGLINTNGTISGDNLQINTQGYALDNNGGKIAARQALNISSGQLNNDAGLLQAGGALSVNTNGQALINTQSGGSKGIVGNGTVTLTAGSLNNQGGYIGAKGALSVSASVVDNSQGGAIVGESAISVTAGSLNNARGQVNGRGNVDINLGAGSLNNGDGLVLAGGTLTVNAGLVNNSNTTAEKGLQGTSVTVNANSIDNSGGSIRADGQLTLNGGNLNNSNGTVSSAGTVTNNTSSINNTQGTLIAAQRLVMNSGTINGIGQYLSTGDLDFNYTGDYTNSSRMVASGSLKIASGGAIVNSGEIGASSALNLSAVNLSNQSSGKIIAGTANITVSGKVDNFGVIDGGVVNVSAGGAVNNYFKIYGDSLGVNAGTINNFSTATVGSRGGMRLTANDINNAMDANVVSLGGMAITAYNGVFNRSGRIESFGDMTISAGKVENRNETITTTTVPLGSENLTEYRLPGAMENLKPGTFAFSGFDNGRLVLDSAAYPIGRYGVDPYMSATTTRCNDSECTSTYNYPATHMAWALFGVASPAPQPAYPPDASGNAACDGDRPAQSCAAYQEAMQQWVAETDACYAALDQKINTFNGDLYARMVEDYLIINATRSTTETRASDNSRPGQIVVGGNLTLNGPGGSVLNSKSQIVVGGAVIGTAQNVQQDQDLRQRLVVDSGTMQLTEIVSSGIFGGHKRIWHTPEPFTDSHTPELLSGQTVWKFDTGTNTRPDVNGKLDTRQGIVVGRAANGASDPSGSVGSLQSASVTASVNSGGSIGSASVNPNGAGVSGAPVGAFNGQSSGSIPDVATVAANAVNDSSNAAVTGSSRDTGVPAASTSAGNSANGTGSSPVSGVGLGDVNAVALATSTVNGAGSAGTAISVANAGATGIATGSVAAHAQGVSLANQVGTPGSAPNAITQGATFSNATASVAHSIAAGTGMQNSIGPAAQAAALPGARRNSVGAGSGSYSELVEVKANGNLSVRSITPTLVVPNSKLFGVRAEPGIGYLIETDPQFVNYRSWLSSDFMLRQLGNDPAGVLKRLGDGFYEQRLVADQIMIATGNRFVGDYTSNQEQYQALMEAGVAYGKQYQLTVGMALSAEQMAALTSDIVWLVRQDVTLADGSVQSVLVPQVYVRVKDGDIRGDGTLIAARDIKLDLTGDLTSNALIASRNLLEVSANNIGNLSGGRLQGATVDLSTRSDLDNLSGQIAGNNVKLDAGRDINFRSVTIDTAELNTSRTGVGATAGVTGDNLTFTAGRDLTVAGAKVSAANDALVTAGRNLNIGTVETSRTLDIAVSGHIREKEVRNLGSQISAGNNLTVASGMKEDGDLRVKGSTLSAANNLFASGTNVTIESAVDTRDLDTVTRLKNATNTVVAHEEGAVISQVSAGRDIIVSATGRLNNDNKAQAGTGDLTLTAAALESTAGTITLVANNDVRLIEQQLAGSRQEENRYRSGTLVSKKSSDSTSDVRRTQSVGTAISGDVVTIGAGHDIAMRAATVVGTGDVTLVAKNDITIGAAQETSVDARRHQEKTSGLFSGGGASITLGKSELDQSRSSESVVNVGSQVGSLEGKVVIDAGSTYTQTASQVLALRGDIDIAAKKVDINSAIDRNESTQQDRTRQSGLTLAVSSPVITAVQAVDKMAEAAGNTSDPRMNALAAATAALAAKNAASELAKAGAANPLAANLSISLGSSKSDSSSMQASTTAVDSTVAAGNNVRIQAKGAGADSNVTVIGGTVSAGNNAVLSAEGSVLLQAAQSTREQHSDNKSSGGSIGVSVGAVTGITLAANTARGNADGQDVTYTNARIEAGNTASITSGRDTVLKGALISGNAVETSVGGNLTIESLQDVSTYTGRQKGSGGSVTIGSSPGASISANKGNVDSSYASVVEQSGIKAGDGGFQVKVEGRTDLKGGVIASSDKALAEGKNNFDGKGEITQSDIANTASYTASSAGTSVGMGSTEVKGVGVGFGSDSGNKTTVTKAGIGVSTGTETSAAIKPIFDAARVQAAVGAEAAITHAFTLEAPKAVASYAGGKSQELKKQAVEASQAGDSQKAKALTEEAAKWDEGGVYRVALHAATGAAGGGASGMVGAALSAGSADLMNTLQGAAQQALQGAGLDAASAKAVAQGVAGLTAAGLGGLVGGAQGAATALAVDANNRQLHTANYDRLREGCRNSSSAECQTINRIAGVRSGMPVDDPSIPASKVVANYDAGGKVVSYVLIDRATNQPTMILETLDYVAYRDAPPGTQALMKLSPQYALDFASAGLYASVGDNSRAAEHVTAGVTSRDYVRDAALGVVGAAVSALIGARPTAAVATKEGVSIGAATDAELTSAANAASHGANAQQGSGGYGAATYTDANGNTIATGNTLPGLGTPDVGVAAKGPKSTVAYPEGLAYRSDFPNHLFGPDGFTKSGHLSGTHNLNNATSALESVGANYKLNPTSTPGISELNYSYINPVNGKPVVASKTVYDPSLYSDQMMLDLSQKAGKIGFEMYLQNPAQRVFDITQNGINFRAYINIDPKTGIPFVGNVHPIK